MIRINKVLVGLLILSAAIFIFTCVRLAREANAAINFTISNPILASDGSIEVDANITGLISSSCSPDGCYLQGQFQSSGGYFGMTYNNSGEFVDYFKNPSSIEEIKTKLFNIMPSSGSWSGKLKVKNNSLSFNYYGPGEYPLSFRRFSGNSLSPTSVESNALVINLTEELPAPSPEASSVPSAPTPTPIQVTLKTAPPTPAPVSSPTPTKTLKPTPTPKIFLTPSSDISFTSSEGGEVLGVEADESPSLTPAPATKPQSKIPLVAIVITFVGIACIAVAGFLAYRKQKEKTLIQ